MNWLDIGITVGIVIGIVHGLFTGLVKQVLSLVSLVAAIYLSGTVAKAIHRWVNAAVQDDNNWVTPNVQNIIYYVLAFILIISIFSLTAKLIDKIINHTPAGILNRIGGAFFGMFFWALCLSMLLNYIAVFDTQSQIITKPIKENSIYYDKVIIIFPMIFPYINEFINTKQWQTNPTPTIS